MKNDKNFGYSLYRSEPGIVFYIVAYGEHRQKEFIEYKCQFPCSKTEVMFTDNWDIMSRWHITRQLQRWFSVQYLGCLEKLWLLGNKGKLRQWKIGKIWKYIIWIWTAIIFALHYSRRTFSKRVFLVPKIVLEYYQEFEERRRGIRDMRTRRVTIKSKNLIFLLLKPSRSRFE